MKSDLLSRQSQDYLITVVGVLAFLLIPACLPPQFASDIRRQMSNDPKTVQGIYRNGKIELLEKPTAVDEARVIVTFLPEGTVNLSERSIDEAQAASLRARLSAFADDWELPEMGAYDAL